MNTTTIRTAHNQYNSRPQDERFPDLSAYLTHSAQKKATSGAKVYNAKDLHIDAAGGTIRIQSPKGPADLTHWSFGQLARSVGAPASYLRDGLRDAPDLAAACLTHGLHHTPPATDLNLLLTLAPDAEIPTARAVTTERYGRVWDYDLHKPMIETLTSGRDGAAWHLPTAWDGKAAGAYSGDRDSFLIMINGGSIVEDPSARQGTGQMYRGIMIRNSEVGAASIVIETVYFRFICGNLMLWGAAIGQTFRRRHVGDNAGRDAIRSAVKLARSVSERSAAQDEQIIRACIDAELATTQDAVIDELRGVGLTEQQARDAYAAAERQEQNPRSRWGIVQGITQSSQSSGYQDQRFALDLAAAAILRPIAKQYA